MGVTFSCSVGISMLMAKSEFMDCMVAMSENSATSEMASPLEAEESERRSGDIGLLLPQISFSFSLIRSSKFSVVAEKVMGPKSCS